MIIDRIEYYANPLRGSPMSALGRKLREVLRDATNEAKAEENEACAKTCEDRAGTMSMFATTRDAKTHNAAVKGDAAAIRARRK